MLFRTAIRWVVVAALTVSATGCSDSGPTTPSGPVPEIARIDPTEVAPGPGTQTLAVSGQGFVTGLVVLLTLPNGTITTISGDAIQAVQNVSFQVSAPFATAGDYRLAVRLLSGAESNEVKITARSTGGTSPRIDTVTPGAVQSGSVSTVVTLTGVNFTTDSSVNFTTPNGATSVLPSSALVAVSSTSVQLSIAFPTAGTYALSVTNGQGQASNTVTVTAF